eukprot:1923105-Rhodomonas_salina.1
MSGTGRISQYHCKRSQTRPWSWGLGYSSGFVGADLGVAGLHIQIRAKVDGAVEESPQLADWAPAVVLGRECD